jgi:hypothetical protein
VATAIGRFVRNLPAAWLPAGHSGETAELGTDQVLRVLDRFDHGGQLLWPAAESLTRAMSTSSLTSAPTTNYRPRSATGSLPQLAASFRLPAGALRHPERPHVCQILTQSDEPFAHQHAVILRPTTTAHSKPPPTWSLRLWNPQTSLPWLRSPAPVLRVTHLLGTGLLLLVILPLAGGRARPASAFKNALKQMAELFDQPAEHPSDSQSTACANTQTDIREPQDQDFYAVDKARLAGGFSRS